MIQLHSGSVMLQGGVPVPIPAAGSGRDKTMAYQILRRHHRGPWEDQLHLTFDSLISHDITYVGIIQTAKASGLREFPVPYVLTNCHNSLCAVGGTINEDDHAFGLSAAVKYGGNYVPANQAVIHQYAREMMAGCGRHDPRLRQPHPLRRSGYHGRGRGRPGDREATATQHL